MRFFNCKKSDVDNTSSIEFENNRFHLSGTFEDIKKDAFGQKIKALKGTYRTSGDVAVTITNYFVIGAKGYTTEGDGKKKDDDINAYNIKNPEKPIHKISQSYCQEFIDKSNIPTPK